MQRLPVTLDFRSNAESGRQTIHNTPASKKRRGFLFRPAWRAKHPAFFRRQSVPVFTAPKTATLVCSNDFLSGTATFQKRDSIWTCTAADPSVKFLLFLDPISAKMQLIRRGFHWQWNSHDSPFLKPSTHKNSVVAEPGPTPANQTSKAFAPLAPANALQP